MGGSFPHGHAFRANLSRPPLENEAKQQHANGRMDAACVLREQDPSEPPGPSFAAPNLAGLASGDRGIAFVLPRLLVWLARWRHLDGATAGASRQPLRG